MTKFYRKALRPTLAARIDEIVAAAPAVQQLSLFDELALVRDQASNAVQLYANVMENPDVKLDQLMAAGVQMTMAMQDVAKMVDVAAKVEEVKQKVSSQLTNSMALLLSTILHAAWETWGDDYKVKEFEEKLRQKMDARDLGTGGTLLTPDMDVGEMDDTVPRIEVENNDA